MFVCVLTSCEKPVAAQVNLKLGFWAWGGYGFDLSAWSGSPLDYIYFQAGELPVDRNAWIRIPSQLPEAAEYWAVIRSDGAKVPSRQSAEYLSDAVAELVGEGRARGIKITGIQLDIDVPTRSLGAYAEWLKLVKADLPPDVQLSVTGLLDWFQGRTGIDGVVNAVDEFVPQFYDLGTPGHDYTNAIAAHVDAAKWGPVFNRFRKRFRIGIATFGRGSMIGSGDAYILNYVSPIEIASHPAFRAKQQRLQTGETMVEFRAARTARFGYVEIQPEQTIRFTLPTAESIRAGVDGAARMGGYCGGVIFFRWPRPEEMLTMQPDAVLSIARGRSGFGTRILASNSECAAVSCEDLFLESTLPVAAEPVKYKIRSSVPLQYFIPDKSIPVKMDSPETLELTLPAYCPRGHLRLGRAVTASKAQFHIEAGAP